MADLRLCSVADLEVEAGSLDLVLTDPPYPAEFDDLLVPLARLCEHGLRDGGSALVMLGQRQLAVAFAAFAEVDLTYRWTLSHMNNGATPSIWPLKLWAAWKPIVWFAKGTPTARRWMNDAINLPNESKSLHGWQQGTAKFQELALGFSGYGDLICDPFLGAGTTAVAAELLGRRFVGCDVDPSCLHKTESRLDAVQDYLRAQRATIAT